MNNMILRLKTKELFTNDGRLIKKMHCPLAAEWDELEREESVRSRMCQACNKKVYDTARIPEETLLKMAQEDKSLCVKVDLDSENVIIDIN
jgi:hypothetical protein